MRTMGLKAPYSIVLQARQLDDLELLIWSLGSGKEADRPKMLANSLIEGDESKDITGFNSGAEFLAERERIIRGIKNG